MNAFTCPKCGELTGGNEKFCVECCQSLNVVCPECGEGWRFMFEYKFCPGCGHQMKSAEAKTTVPEMKGQKVKGKK